MSRQLVDAPPTVAGAAPAGGLALRTLADRRRFELTACCAACERYVNLDHAALAARFGWGAPLDALRRRFACRRCGARTGRVLIGHARGPERGRNATGGRLQGGARMSERDDKDEERQEPVRVASREEFDEAVEELFRTGRPIEAPSLEALAGWDVDLEDEEGAIEGAL